MTTEQLTELAENFATKSQHPYATFDTQVDSFEAGFRKALELLNKAQEAKYRGDAKPLYKLLLFAALQEAEGS